MHRAFGFLREVGGAVSREHRNGKDGNRDGVPIEQTNIAARHEIGEKGHREVAGSVERDTAPQIARSGAEKNGQQKVGEREDEVPKSLPERVVDVSTNFNRNAAQNQTP